MVQRGSLRGGTGASRGPGGHSGPQRACGQIDRHGTTGLQLRRHPAYSLTLVANSYAKKASPLPHAKRKRGQAAHHQSREGTVIMYYRLFPSRSQTKGTNPLQYHFARRLVKRLALITAICFTWSAVFGPATQALASLPPPGEGYVRPLSESEMSGIMG